MNREIKFRAWDTNTGKFELFSLAINPDNSIVPFTNESQEDEVIINQYTGLKDKNGKEIYEGDILSGTTPNGLKDQAWECPSLNFFHHYQELECALEEYGDIEVIGNIYENKYLLNER